MFFIFAIKRSFSRFFQEAIENLLLAICKCQRWKEQVKISECRKFGDLMLKTVTLVSFLERKNNTPKCMGVCMGSKLAMSS